MKIIVVGGTGTIGRAVIKELERRHKEAEQETQVVPEPAETL